MSLVNYCPTRGAIMKERPKSITIVCWILIVTGVFSLFSSTLHFNDSKVLEIMSKIPLPISIQYILIYAGSAITFLCGIAMLKRQNWARFLYAGWKIISLTIGVATFPMKVLLIPGIIVFLIIAYFLFRPRANEYFKARAIS